MMKPGDLVSVGDTGEVVVFTNDTLPVMNRTKCYKTVGNAGHGWYLTTQLKPTGRSIHVPSKKTFTEILQLC